MPVDYDTPRPNDTDDDTTTPAAGVAPQDGQLWEEIDDGDSATSLDFGTVDITDDDVRVVIPLQDNEFSCVGCFLIHPLAYLDHRTLLGAVCTECAS